MSSNKSSSKSSGKTNNKSGSTGTNSSKSSSSKNALHNFKMETAREVGVTLKDGYNGELTSKQAGSIGGQMVKKLVEQAESNLK